MQSEMPTLPQRGAEKATPKPRGRLRDTASSGPRSLHRMLGIFDFIARSPDGLSLAELAAQLESPKSSLLTLLRPLVTAGYLVHSNGRYSLGNETFVLASNIMSAHRFSAVVRGVMAELQRHCAETIILAVMDRATQTVMYTDVLESPQFIRYSVPPGTARPLYASSAGQLLLAFQDERWREQFLRKVPLKPLTPRTITDVGRLRQRLDDIRRDGVCVSISEAVEGASGVSAPIFGSDGAVSAALLIAGPTDRYAREGQSWSDLAKEYASRASRAIGYRSGAASPT